METCVSTFLKLGARKYLVISVVMVAVVLELDVHRIKSARIAVGSCPGSAKATPAEDDQSGKKLLKFSKTPSPEHLLSLTLSMIFDLTSYRKMQP